MGLIVGAVLFFIVFGVVVSLVEKGAKGINSRVVRPYIGLLLIAALIAGLGFVLGFLFNGLQDFFFTIAKVVAVSACAALCLHLIVAVAKRWL